MREIRSILCSIFVVASLLFFTVGSASALDASLLQGGVKKGEVPLIDQDGLRYAALDEILSCLGLAESPAKGGLVATFSGKKIEFWGGSAAARVNGMVFSLPSAVFEKNGHWWGEVNASLQAMSQFLASAGRPSDLKFETVSSSGSSQPSSAGSVKPTVAPTVKPEAPSTTVAVPVVGSGATLLSQVRWGEQGDAYRAVVDISRQIDVKVTHKSGAIDITFPNTTSPSIKNDSPWKPLSVSSSQASTSTVLTFTHNAKNVKGFWLEDPPRYVMDFYFDKNAAATQVADVEPTPSAPIASVKPTPVQPRNSARGLVVIDAGHGGHDPGAVGNGLKEKDINLKAANELAASLKKLGMDVKLTRANDKYLKLEERTKFANDNNAAVFISLHCNALPKGKHATGIELYLMADSTDKDALNLAILENRELSGTSQTAAEVNAAADKKTKLLLMILGDMQQNDKINESTTLAEFMYDRMKGVGLSIRKVRQAPFFVLRGAGMPALLVEMGYITEKSDAQLLNSAAHRKKMMDAMAQGIANYVKRGPREGGR